jgi:hypothetical protein
MFLHYLPTKEFIIDNVPLQFGAHRELVRAKLGGGHKEQNQIIPLSESVKPLVQRRDIYDNLNSKGDYFFLNYDENDLLNELEVHRCEKIQVFDFLFDFDDDLDLIALELSKYSPISKRGDGEYFFKDLCISIIDEMHMGGEDKSTISYFYCASDVSHLEE